MEDKGRNVRPSQRVTAPYTSLLGLILAQPHTAMSGVLSPQLARPLLRTAGAQGYGGFQGIPQLA